MVYLVLDCYPKIDSRFFERFAGGAAGCWVRKDICVAGQSAEALATDRLSEEGWAVVRSLLCEEVSAATYVTKVQGREYFEQAQIDGFVVNFHVVRRESVGEDDSPQSNVAQLLANAVYGVNLNGGVSLFSVQDRQWANGVTPDGNEFLPIWLAADDALRWRESWPGYELRALSLEELCSSDFLDQVDSEEMWIGIGVGGSLLTMCHAGWIRAVVLGREIAAGSSVQ